MYVGYLFGQKAIVFRFGCSYRRTIALKCGKCSAKYKLRKNALVSSMRAVTGMGARSGIIAQTSAEEPASQLLERLFQENWERYRRPGQYMPEALMAWRRAVETLAKRYIEAIKESPPTSADLIARGGAKDLCLLMAQHADLEILYAARDQRIRLHWECAECHQIQPYPW